MGPQPDNGTVSRQRPEPARRRTEGAMSASCRYLGGRRLLPSLSYSGFGWRAWGRCDCASWVIGKPRLTTAKPSSRLSLVWRGGIHIPDASDDFRGVVECGRMGRETTLHSVRRQEGAVMAKKSKRTSVSRPNALYGRIRTILESAKSSVARSVNTTQVVANWLIGREIGEEEQRGKRRADYGGELVAQLSRRLAKDFGPGFSVPNLRNMRQFYGLYPSLIDSSQIRYALRSESSDDSAASVRKISNALRSKSAKPPGGHKQHPQAPVSGSPIPPLLEIHHAVRSESWQPGQLHPNLSWTHYRILMRVESADARGFYEIEAIQNAMG